MSEDESVSRTRQALYEFRLISSTILGIFLGRKVWLPPEKPPNTDWIRRARKRNLPLARTAYQERLKEETEGVERVRRRAEFAMTAIIAAIGLSAASFEQLWASASESAVLLVVWIVGLILVIVAILIFAGVAVARKEIGTVMAEDLTHLRRPQRAELCSYVSAVHATSRTRRAMVTVFRDGFLVALAGLLFFAIAHITAWILPAVDSPVSSCNVCEYTTDQH